MNTTIGNSIETAINWLKQGEVVAIPTETVYGLAANALDEQAVLKIFKAKNRPHFNPLIVHAANWERLSEFVKNVPGEAMLLAKMLSPGPLTFLLEKSEAISDLVTAGHSKVAVRIPNHPVTLQLLREISFPLAAPSANRFGYVSPTSAAHVKDGLEGFIPYILDGGDCEIGLESTILDFEEDQIILRRKGGISLEKIETVLGKKVISRTHAHEHPVAPGQLKSHYATHTPLFLGNIHDLLPAFKGKKVAVIGFGEPLTSESISFSFSLSSKGNLDEAARNLFKVMREADHCGAEVILANWLPDYGLGAAINDRLKRAEHSQKG